MKPRSKIVDFSFRRNKQHALAGILEYALVITITAIAVSAAASVLKEQIALLI